VPLFCFLKKFFLGLVSSWHCFYACNQILYTVLREGNHGINPDQRRCWLPPAYQYLFQMFVISRHRCYQRYGNGNHRRHTMGYATFFCVLVCCGNVKRKRGYVCTVSPSAILQCQFCSANSNNWDDFVSFCPALSDQFFSDFSKWSKVANFIH
jgi:hypothetical protein